MGYVYVIVILLILIAIYYIYTKRCSSCQNSKSSYQGERMPTQLLKDANWELYTINTCVYCREQKEYLDDPYFATECGGTCTHKAHPLWVNTQTGEERVGRQSLLELKRMAGVAPKVV